MFEQPVAAEQPAGPEEAPSNFNQFLDYVASSLQQTAGNTEGIVTAGRDLVKEAEEGLADPTSRRAFMRGAGATVFGTMGALAGSPATPAGSAAGAVGGTMVGSLIGDEIANATQSVLDYYHGQPGDPSREAMSTVEKAQDLAWQVSLDGAISGLPFIPPGLSKKGKDLFAKLLGLDPNSEAVRRAAAEFEVPIGIANISPRPRDALSIFGQMPIIGGGAKNALKAQAYRAVQAKQQLFGRVVDPNRELTEVSKEAFVAANEAFDRFALRSQQGFQQALRLGRRAGRAFPTDRVTRVAQEQLRRLTRTVGGQEGPTLHMPPLLRRAVEGAANLDVNRLSLDEMMTLRAMTEQAMDAGESLHHTQFDALVKINDAIDASIARVAEARPVAGQFGNTPNRAVAAKQAAQQFVKNMSRWHNGLKDFEGTVGRTVSRIENGIFKRGPTTKGSRTPDEYLDMMRNVNSPDKVRQLSRLSGPHTVLQLARYKMDDAWFKATGYAPGDELGDQLSFDGKAFRKALGLDNKNSNKYAAFREMLVNSELETSAGSGIRQVEKFAELMESYGNIPLESVNKFMTRAAGLRGAGGIGKAVQGALTAGAGPAVATSQGGWISGLMTGLATLGVLRKGMSWTLSPKSLRLVNTAIDDRRPIWARRVAILQMVKQGVFGQPPEDIDRSIEQAAGTPSGRAL